MDKRTLKFILLLVASIILVFISFAYSYVQFSKSDSVTSNNKQYSTPPITNTQIEIVGDTQGSKEIVDSLVGELEGKSEVVPQSKSEIKKEINWRDEIVLLHSESFLKTASAYNPASATVFNGVENSKTEIDTLYAQMEKLSQHKSNYLNRLSLNKITTSTILDIKNSMECGVIKMPDSESSQKRFLSKIEKEDPVICIGKAIANKCSDAKIDVIVEDIEQAVYVSEINGECNIGLSFDNKHATMCNLEDLMNSVFEEENKLSEWQNMFKTKPGVMFASLYFNSTDSFFEAMADNAGGCKALTLIK